MTTDVSAASDPKWLKLTFNVPTVLTEAAADLAGVLSGAGVEQTPDHGKGCVISAFFALNVDEDIDSQVTSTKNLFGERLGELFSLYDEQIGEIRTELLADEDWATSWQRFFHTFEITPGLVIKPSWEEYQPDSGQQVIEMDPGMAFGTGQHASTKLALALIGHALGGPEQEAPQAGLDIGTGTGILAMAAALNGVSQVTAIDNDPDAVAAALDNVAHNNLARSITCSDAPLEAITGTFGLICANIVHDVLIDMAAQIRQLAAPHAHLVLAGILHGEQEQNIITVYEQLGFKLVSPAYEDEWVALYFTLV